ncbi:MAG TPA: M23 family metallopeptidase [Candidatus Limnocylindria bacterium]|jgi:hypothetical protein|nr:M23 family metallopeptidase [Candidatus Limnocylindria bacterium]
MIRWHALAAAFFALPLFLSATPFELPTTNRALLDADGGTDRYFVGTEGKLWPSGQFGCVRTDGWQFHEGMDIRPMTHDKHGEPADLAMAAADGVVAYFNTRTGLSNYGNYVVLRHRIEGLEVFTLYAHLAQVQPGLKVGQIVKTGQPVGTMGRTSNTRQRITKERGHLHFEIDFMASERYAEWHRSRLATTRNDHGDFNGFNLFGLDPAGIFHEQQRLQGNFRLSQFIRMQPELCQVRLRVPEFSWSHRYRGLAEANPLVQHAPIAGWDVSLTFNGIPCRMIPRTAAELGKGPKVQLLSVNEANRTNSPCGRLVVQRGAKWVLTHKGEQLLDLMTY